MGLFGSNHEEHEQNYQDVYERDQPKHEGKFSHEALSGAAGEYEKHLEKTGQKPSHQLFKEIAAGIAAGEVDKLCETKGLDYIDREKAKRQAQDKAEEMGRYE